MDSWHTLGHHSTWHQRVLLLSISLNHGHRGTYILCSSLLVPFQRPFRASSAPTPRSSIRSRSLTAHFTKPNCYDIISQIVAQLVSFPMGRAWARWMPNVCILGVSLNPGLFTIKEHVGKFCQPHGRTMTCILLSIGTHHHHGGRWCAGGICGRSSLPWTWACDHAAKLDLNVRVDGNYCGPARLVSPKFQFCM